MARESEPYRASIPDDDMPGWMETLRTGGFSEKEIDDILAHLNKTYAKAKGLDLVDNELKKIEDYIQQTYGRKITPEQREHLRKSITERPEFKK